MAQLRATRFYKGSYTGPTLLTMYTVPTGRRVIIKSVVMKNEAASTTLVSLYVNGAGRVLLQSLGLSGGGADNFEWRPWLVLNDGDLFSVTCDSGHTIDLVVSGTSHFI